mgnify:CR=1 FL=1
MLGRDVVAVGAQAAEVGRAGRHQLGPPVGEVRRDLDANAGHEALHLGDEDLHVGDRHLAGPVRERELRLGWVGTNSCAPVAGGGLVRDVGDLLPVVAVVGDEVLQDDLLQVAVLGVQRGQGGQRVEPVLGRLADADEDPAGEGDLQLAGGADGLQAHGRHLGGRSLVGDEVGADHLIQIEAIRQLAYTGYSGRQTAGMAILTGILLALLLFFAHFVTLNQWSYPRLVWFLLLTLTVNLLLLKISWFVCESVSQSFLTSPFNDKTYFFYLLPFACGSMLVSLLAGERCAHIFIIFFCILAGQVAGMEAYGLFYILIVNLAGILFMRKAQQRIRLIGAGFKLGLVSAVLYILIQAAAGASLDPLGTGFGAGLAFLSGPFNAFFLVFTLPLCERVFMVTTEIRLSELGNMSLPLVRDLMTKAPGTYSHSITVGTLCEGAAKVIGLNPLFLRIAGLYHDIGKTLQPGYFVENQKEFNPHDELPPQESVRILKRHVSEGIALARRARLPSSLAELIPQHHGTKWMPFFFEKAKNGATGTDGEIQQAAFRYPGPKPQTKSAAILMLADSIEAAARTLSDHSQDRLLDLIRKLIADTIADEQFSECDITLSEIDRVTYSFLETLSSHYHGRIVYPPT